MPYLLFNNKKDTLGTITKFVENEDSLNIFKKILNFETIKIIQVSADTFEQLKLDLIFPAKFTDNDQITYINNPKIGYQNKQELDSSIKFKINEFSINRIEGVDYTEFDQYIEQLKQLNIDGISFPMNVTLEQYLKNNSKIYINTLQRY
jgi:hypothetical protein